MAVKRQAGAATSGLDPTETGGAGGGRSEGGAGGSTGRPSEPPSLVPVLIGGKTYQVPSEIAESIAEEQSSFHRERGRLTGELEQLKTRKPEKTPTAELELPERPDWELATTDYRTYDRQLWTHLDHRFLDLEQRLENRLSKKYDDQTQASRNRADLDAFIGRLSHAYPSLEGEEQIIMTAMGRVATKHPNDPLPFKDPRTLKLVGEEGTAELARLVQKGKSLAPNPPVIERQGGVGGTGAGSRSEERQSEKGPTSIAEIQRERRLRRLHGARVRLGGEED